MSASNEKHENGFVKIFPQRLMELLSHDDTSESITWTSKGDAFMIVKESSFIEKVLPRFFKKSKISSFKGKLYRWGFKRNMMGKNRGSFFHKFFLRDNPALCLHMRRNQRDVLDFPNKTPLVKASLGKRNRITENSNLLSSDQTANIVPQVVIHGEKEATPIPNLQNPLFSPIAYSSDYYNQALLRAHLAREVLCKEAALRIQMKAQLIGKRQEIHALLAVENHMLNIIPPVNNVSLSQMLHSQEVSAFNDNIYLSALSRL